MVLKTGRFTSGETQILHFRPQENVNGTRVLAWFSKTTDCRKFGVPTFLRKMKGRFFCFSFFNTTRVRSLVFLSPVVARRARFTLSPRPQKSSNLFQSRRGDRPRSSRDHLAAYLCYSYTVGLLAGRRF